MVCERALVVYDVIGRTSSGYPLNGLLPSRAPSPFCQKFYDVGDLFPGIMRVGSMGSFSILCRQ